MAGRREVLGRHPSSQGAHHGQFPHGGQESKSEWPILSPRARLDRAIDIRGPRCRHDRRASLSDPGLADPRRQGPHSSAGYVHSPWPPSHDHRRLHHQALPLLAAPGRLLQRADQEQADRRDNLQPRHWKHDARVEGPDYFTAQ